MSNKFLSKNLWSQLTTAVRLNKSRCDIAVAYFGTGAGRLLPLAKGSRLVVDASERAVGSGQTNPSDLSQMMSHGVRVHSVPNLHAKVFVVGRGAFIGSANASSHSAQTLIETLLYTTDNKTVAAARQFVLSHCLHELTPTLIKRLKKLYRPPRFTGRTRVKSRPRANSNSPVIPRLRLVKLTLVNWSVNEQKVHDKGTEIAMKRRKHPKSYELDSFRYSGDCSFEEDDVVVQVTDEGGGRVLVSPPGNIRYIRFSNSSKMRFFVYIERPANKRRKTLERLVKKLGPRFESRFRRGGVVQNQKDAEALLGAWS